MLWKSTMAFGLLAVSAKLASATPPACLLAAVNTLPSPTDFNSICKGDSTKFQRQIRDLCGANTDAAISAYSSVCSSAGFHVSTVVPKKKSPQTAKETSKEPQHPKTVVVTRTSEKGGAATPKPKTEPSPPSSPTPDSKPSSPEPDAGGRVDANGFAALALAAAGLAVFL